MKSPEATAINPMPHFAGSFAKLLGGWCRRFAAAAYIAFVAARLLGVRLRCRKRLLILFRAGGLGDILATIPAVVELRRHYPDHYVVFCTRPEFSGVVELIPGVDRVLGVFHGDAIAVFVSRWFDARRFRYPDEYAVPSTQHFVQEMAASVGIHVLEGAAPRIDVTAVTDEEFTAWFGAPLAGRLIVALHLGPSAPVKEWPLDHWRTVAGELARRSDLVIVQIGTGRHFLHGSKDITLENALHPARPLSLLDSARLLKRCALMVGIDSGPLHLAAAVGTPTIGLYGPVNPALRAPYGTRAISASPRLDCQFCHHRIPRGHWDSGCPHQILCMEVIRPEDVIAAARQIYDRAEDLHLLKNPHLR